MENPKSVDQKPSPALALIEDRPQLFATQGTVVATWRNYQERVLGPFFRLAFRDDAGKQKSLYIGQSDELAEEVRKRLAELRRPHQERRAERQFRAELRASLRGAKRAWELELKQIGLRAHGYEVRGWRRAKHV